MVGPGVDRGTGQLRRCPSSLDQSHHLAASLSHVETRPVRNDYTFPLDADFYQIERQSIVSGLRRAHVGVEKRRDGSLAVSFGERYLPVSLCAVAEKTKASPVKPASSRRPRTRPQGSERRKNFNWKKGPKIWQVAQHSDYNRSSADGLLIRSPRVREEPPGQRRPVQGNPPHDRNDYPDFKSSQQSLRRSPLGPLPHPGSRPREACTLPKRVEGPSTVR